MSLAGDIAKFNEKVNFKTEREFRGSVIALTNQTIQNTPVDTGRLRANWQLTVNYRAQSQIALGAQPDPGIVANRLKFNDTAYLSNNLPYAEPVENGGPTNRPRKMLARAIMQVTKNL